MSKVGDVIENPVTGEREMVRIGTEQTDGELLVAALYIWPGGVVIGEHRHPAIGRGRWRLFKIQDQQWPVTSD
jgi:hypothetical protein